jgi:hypothetical protein
LLPLNCSANEYPSPDAHVCKKKPAFCAQFATQGEICSACQVGFQLVNNTCQRLPAKEQCPGVQVKVNGVCQVIDENCIFLGNNSKCSLCSRGYEVTLLGTCSWIQCGPRQYNGEGYCFNVDAQCQDFDKVEGNCFTCKDSTYVVFNGKCMQTVDGYTGGQSGQGLNCPPRYYPNPKKDGCLKVSDQCDTYVASTGECTACLNSTDYQLSNGVCVSLRSYCAGTPRTYFSNGQCLSVSPTCGDYNASNGRCLTCSDNTLYNSATGQCLYNDVCLPELRQYKKADGSCGTADVNCASFLQSGVCTACKANYDLNTGGYCCPTYNYLSDPKCKQFQAQNCASFDPSGYCDTCKAGYAKAQVGGYPMYYSKCQ